MEGSTELAWGLTIAASLSTILGAAFVLCVPSGNVVPKPLIACSLGCASGVMLYVGCAELFSKSQEEVKGFQPFLMALSGDSCVCCVVTSWIHLMLIMYVCIVTHAFMCTTWQFLASGEVESRAKLLTTSCFFAGAIFVWLMNLAVHYIAPTQMHDFELSAHHTPDPELEEHDHGIAVAAGGHDHGDGDGWHAHPKEDEEPVQVHVDNSSVKNCNDHTAQAVQGEFTDPAAAAAAAAHVPLESRVKKVNACDDKLGNARVPCTDDTDTALYRLGLATVLAIALHNYPEGNTLPPSLRSHSCVILIKNQRALTC